MKKTRTIILLILTLAMTAGLSSCKGYDEAKCESLTEMIIRGRMLDQNDYADMLDQYEDILKYLIGRSDEIIAEQDQQTRKELQKRLRNDEEYLKRFGYMFTFGSALYQADVANLHDENN